jgi:general secretion pathway protein M
MLKHLSEREKYAIVFGMACLVFFLFLHWAVFPVVEQRKRTARQVAVKLSEIVEMQRLQSEYRQIQSAFEKNRTQLQKRSPQFSLFSYLDELAGQTGLKKKIVYMKPTTVDEMNSKSKLSRVEIKIQEVTLDQVSRFLYSVESSPNMISVPRLSITRKNQGSGLLEAVFQVETLEG